MLPLFHMQDTGSHVSSIQWQHRRITSATATYRPPLRSRRTLDFVVTMATSASVFSPFSPSLPLSVSSLFEYG